MARSTPEAVVFERDLPPVRFATNYYAEMVKGVLEARGIPCLNRGCLLHRLRKWGDGGKDLISQGRKREAEAIRRRCSTTSKPLVKGG